MAEVMMVHYNLRLFYFSVRFDRAPFFLQVCDLEVYIFYSFILNYYDCASGKCC